MLTHQHSSHDQLDRLGHPYALPTRNSRVPHPAAELPDERRSILEGGRRSPRSEPRYSSLWKTCQAAAQIRKSLMCETAAEGVPPYFVGAV